jgi:hypothetical protein
MDKFNTGNTVANDDVHAPEIAHFVSLREEEISKATEMLGMTDEVDNPKLFVAHVALVLGGMIKKKGKITFDQFIPEFAKLLDMYHCTPVGFEAFIKLGKHFYSGKRGNLVRELAKRHKDSATDHLQGRFLAMTASMAS